MILGDPLTGMGGDTLRQAYAKFNRHTHGRVVGSCYNYGFRPGMIAEIKDENGQPLTTPGTLIVEVGADYLKVDRNLPAANRLVVVGTLHPHSATATGAYTDGGRTVYIPPKGGELPATLARGAEMKVISGLIPIKLAPPDVLVTYLNGPEGNVTEVRTAKPNSAVQAILVGSPTQLVPYQFSACLTSSAVQVAVNARATVKLRKNQTSLPGQVVCVPNEVRPDSRITYAQTSHTNITVGPTDILYAVLDLQDVPNDAHLAYTLTCILLYA